MSHEAHEVVAFTHSTTHFSSLTETMFSSLLSPTASAQTRHSHVGSFTKSETHRDKIAKCASTLLFEVVRESLPRRKPFSHESGKVLSHQRKSNLMLIMDIRHSSHSMIIHPHAPTDARKTACTFLVDTFDKLLFPKPLLLRDLHTWASLVGLRMNDIRMLTALFCANSVRQLPVGIAARGRADKSFGNCADMLGVLLMPHSTCLQVMGLPRNILTARMVEYFAATHTRVSATPAPRARNDDLVVQCHYDYVDHDARKVTGGIAYFEFLQMCAVLHSRQLDMRLSISFRILDRSSTLTLGRVDLAHLLIATLRDSRVQVVSQNIQNVINNTMRLGDLDGSGRLDFHEYTVMLQNPDNRGFLDRYFNISFTRMFQYLS